MEPDRAASWFRARPVLQVAVLHPANVLRRWPLPAASVALSLLGLGALMRIPILALAASGDTLLIIPLAAVLLATIILLRRQRLARDRHRDWLSPLPAAPSLTARAAVETLPIFCAIVLVSLGASVAAGLRLRLPGLLVLATLSSYVLAAMVLAVSGIVRRQRRKVRTRHIPYEPPPSRYAPVRRVRAGWATQARLVPLGYWPIARTGFLDRPRRRARVIALLLLAIPLNVSGAAAIAVVAAGLVVLHLVNLVVAVIRVAFAAGWWLAPTPVGAVRFAAAVSHRALAAEIFNCTLLGAAVCVLEGQHGLQLALTVGLTWVVGVGLLCAATCIAAVRTPSIARSALHRWLG